MLDENWPGLFKEHILDELPVDEMRPFFHEDFGRPSKEIHTVLGVLLLQQAMDLNVEVQTACDSDGQALVPAIVTPKSEVWDLTSWWRIPRMAAMKIIESPRLR